MATHEPRAWGIHAGRNGNAESLFLEQGVVAIGWAKCGDLGKVLPDRAAFERLFVTSYPDATPGAIPRNVGQLYRFVHEMRTDDFVIYPSKLNPLVHIGRVHGEYRHDPEREPEFPHVRPVEWLKSIPRSHFTQGALYELSNGMSMIRVKHYADEFLAALE